MVNKTTKAMFKNATSCVVSALLAVSVFLGCLSAYNPESARATEDQDNTQAAMAVNDTPAKEEVQAPAPEAAPEEAPAPEAAPEEAVPEAEPAPEVALPAEADSDEPAEEAEAAQDVQEPAAEEPGQQNPNPGSGEEVTEPAAENPEANNEEAASSATDAKNTKAKDAEKPAAFEASQTVDGVVVSVKAEEGAFPKGSTLSVRKVNASEQSAAEAAVEGKRHEGENVAVSYTFDIKVLDKDKKEIQPAKGKKVEVAFKAAEVANQNLETNVYHLKKEGSLVAESLDTKEQGSTVSAQTTGFSYYTVEFTYGDLQYVMDGDSEIPLSIILDKIGLSGTVTAATSSNPELFSVENNGSDWTVKALQAFCSEETLSLTIDGIDYVVKVTDSQHNHPSGSHGESGTWSPWSDSANLPTASGNYYLNTDVTRSRPQIPKSGTATIKLCLNGHKITLSGGNNGLYDTDSSRKVNLTIYDSDDNSGIITNTSTYGSVIRIKGDGSTYTLAGGKITNCNCSSWNTPVYVDGGTFTMKGGMICNNTLTDYAPVYVASGTFNMSGGTITGNTNKKASGVVASGVHVASGTFNMSGGSITNNNSPDANSAAGVYFQNSGLFNVKGKVTITGNTSKGKDLNVLVNSNRTIGINGNLDSDSRIGVTTATAPSGSTTIQFTNGLSGKGSKTNFISDNSDYTVMIKNNEAHLNEHKHEFNYTAEGDTITATCVNMVTDCPLEDRKTTLKIVAPALEVYGGTESEKATLEGEIPGVTPPAIVYLDGPETSTTAPKNAGEYTAEITLTGSDTLDATASVDYTIEKADISPVVNIDGWNYGDTPKSPSVTAASNPGSGAATFKYYTDEACTTETSAAQGATEAGGVPAKGGDYWVKATVAETDNYKSGTGSKKFTIATKPITATGLKYDSKVYDGNTDATLGTGEAQLVGVQTGDDVRIKSATGTFDNKNVGTGKTIGSITIELEGDDAGGYSATAAPATVTGAITARPVTVSGITASDKTYDGNRSATLDCTKATINNVVDGETLGVSATGTFSDKNVGDGKTVALSEMALTGGTAGNYSLTADCQKDTTASISPKPLKVSGITANSKVYDGTTEASINTGSASYDGKVDGDDVQVDIASAQADFSDKNVGTGKAVTVTFDLSGADKDNYTATLDGEVKGDITPKPVKVGGITVDDRQYDKTTDAPLNTSNATFGGKVDGDVLTVSGIGTYNDPNAGLDKNVTISGLTLGGTDKDNYTVAADSQKESTGTILQREVTVSGITAGDKTYDGNIDATLNLDELVLDGNLDDGNLTIDADAVTGAFEDKTAGTDKTVTISGLQLTGDAASNYKLAETGQQTETTASINKKPVTVSDIAANDKTYDGTEAAELEYKDAVVTGKLDNDDVTVSAKGSFSDKNVGEDKTVAISGITLGGDDADNYELASEGQQNSTTASITKRPVTVSGITADDKVYDGNADATLDTSAAEFEDIISGDTLSVSATGAFEDANAGEGKTVTISDLVLSGESVANYELASEGQQAETTAAITPKPINVAAEAASKAYGEEDPELTYTGDPLIGEDAYTGALEREEGEEAGTYEIGQGSLTAGDNYEITYTPADFTITKAETNSVTAAIEGWTYGDAAKEPSATATYGQDTATFTYSDAADGTYTSTVPTDAGTYFVKASIADTPSYPAAESEPVEFTIAPKPVTPAMLSLDKESVKKAGSKQGPTITLTDGTVLVEGKDYTLSGEPTADKTGTHFFTVTGIGNYTDSFESSWYMYEDKQNSATEEGEDGAGNIEIFVDIVGNTESISVNNFTIDFAKALLTEADLSKRAEGANITLYVEVAEVPSSEVPETDRALLKAFFDGKGATDIRWFDITVWKKVGNDPAAQIHELGSALELTISVPDDYKDAPANTTRTFYFGTAHNGAYKLLSETTDKAVSFSASEFSTFALAYKDVKASDAGNDGKATKSPIKAAKATTAKTADSTNVPALTCLALVSSLLLAVAALRRRKEEEAK